MKISNLSHPKIFPPMWQKLSWGQRTVCLIAGCLIIALIFKKAAYILKNKYGKKPPSPDDVRQTRLADLNPKTTTDSSKNKASIEDNAPTPTKRELTPEKEKILEARALHFGIPHIRSLAAQVTAHKEPMAKPPSDSTVSNALEQIKQEIETLRNWSNLKHTQLIEPGTTKDLSDDVLLQDYLDTCLGLKDTNICKAELEAPLTHILERKIKTVKDLRALSILDWSDIALKNNTKIPNPRNLLKDNITDILNNMARCVPLCKRIAEKIPLDLKLRKPLRKEALEKLASCYDLIFEKLNQISENTTKATLSKDKANFEEIKKSLVSLDYLRQIWLLRCYLFQQDMLSWIRQTQSFNALSDYTQRYPIKTWELFNLASKRLEHETMSEFFNRAQTSPEFKNIQITPEFLKKPITFNFSDLTSPIEFYLEDFLDMEIQTKENILESSIQDIRSKKICMLQDLEVLGLLSFLELNLNPIAEREVAEEYIIRTLEQLKRGLSQLIKLRDAVITYNQKEARGEIILLTQGVNILQRNISSFNHEQELASKISSLNDIILEARAMFYLHHIYLLKNYLLQEGIDRFTTKQTSNSLSDWNKTKQYPAASFFDVLSM